MTTYQAPSLTDYKCTVGWLRGHHEDGYFYAVWRGDDECVSGGGLGHKPYRWQCDPDQETNLPTIADLMMDSWSHIDWDSPQGQNLIRTLIDDAWQEALPDLNGPPRQIKRIIQEALYGPAGAQSATG